MMLLLMLLLVLLLVLLFCDGACMPTRARYVYSTNGKPCQAL